jgi:hypothetical protein
MKAERELCLQDVATFKKLREGIRDRKPKFWFITTKRGLAITGRDQGNQVKQYL